MQRCAVLIAFIAWAGSVMGQEVQALPSTQYLAHVMGKYPSVALPIVTPGLVPRRLMGAPTFPNTKWLTQPLFVVGDDLGSRAWLLKNRDFLSHQGALGILVQARDGQSLQAVLEIAQGLPIAPAPSSRLAAELKAVRADVLPVLILTDGSIVQDIQSDARVPR